MKGGRETGTEKERHYVTNLANESFLNNTKQFYETDKHFNNLRQFFVTNHERR